MPAPALFRALLLLFGLLLSLRGAAQPTTALPIPYLAEAPAIDGQPDD